MPKITFHGHACFLLEGDNGEDPLIFDPYLNDNPQAKVKAEQLEVSYILISHAHQDHLGDAFSMAEANQATIISTSEISRNAQGQGLKAHAMHIGGKCNFSFGWVKPTVAFHGAGIDGGHACGFVVNFFDKKIYFAGDTGLFGDMKLIGDMSLDLALLPIGDNFTMGMEDAVIAASYLKAQTIIPYHYNTWPLIEADPEKYRKEVEEKTNAECIVMAPGESCPI